MGNMCRDVVRNDQMLTRTIAIDDDVEVVIKNPTQDQIEEL